MEKMFTEADKYSQTEFCTTRFGNMIDSTGSIISYWKSNPNLNIKLTHENVERFFFTVNDAVTTVLNTFEKAEGGNIFFFFFKKAKIKNILKLITGRADFEIIGLFPGEKIYEELIGEHEKYFTYEFENHYIIDSNKHNTSPTTAYSTQHAESITQHELKKLIYG